MRFQPNRPVRVGTERMFTDASGNVPGHKKTAKTETPSSVDLDVVDPFLDRSVADITADLGDQSDEHLAMILRAERKGKTRKSAVAAIEAEIEKRKG